MSSPSSFAYHVGKDIIVNHEDIYHEIVTAISDYHAQKWLDFGVQVGTALHKIIIGTSEKFAEFEQTFGKVYSPEERVHRIRVFEYNLKQIRELRRVEHGTAVYSHLTPFADLTRE